MEIREKGENMLAKRRETQTEREPPKIQATEKEAKMSEKMMGE